MGYLFPLYLLGAAAIAAPIIFHLTRQTPKERISFSSTMFLEEAPVRMKRRNRLEHIFLLLLRCLALLLITLAFARPFFSGDSAAAGEDSASQTLFLVDASASMQRPRLWSSLLTELQAALEQHDAQDRIAVYTYHHRVEKLSGFDEWEALGAQGIIERLQAFTAFGGGTDTGSALMQVADTMEDDFAEVKEHTVREIQVFTDAQSGTRLDALHSFEWSEDITLTVHELEAEQPGNASMHLIVSADDSDLGENATTPWIRINNSPDAAEEQFILRWAGQAQPTVSLNVPAGQSTVIRAPDTPTGIPGERLELSGDVATFDNELFIAPFTERQVNVLFVGEHEANNPKLPFYFLSRALMNTRNLTPVVTTRRADDDLTGIDASAIDFSVVAETPTGDLIPLLRTYLNAGGVVVYLLPENDRGEALSALSGDTVQASEAVVEDFALISHLELKHPLLKVFSDPEFGDFSNVHFWKYRKLTHASGTPLARFDGTDPAIIEWVVGKGKILALTAGWHPADSQLALSSRFIPLLFSMLEYAGGFTSGKSSYVDVGAPVPIPERISQVTLPDGSTVTFEDDQALFTQTDQPGIYRFVGDGQNLPFAVNHPAAESRTEPLSPEAIVAATHPDKEATEIEETGAASDTSEDREDRQKLWRWLIMGVWGALMIETGLAGRKRTSPAGPSA